LLAAAPTWATEWHSFGARAMGMGGVGVALAQGPVGAYWNPAGLGQIENPSGLQIPLSAHAELSGPVLEGANDLNQIGKDCQAAPGAGACTTANINAALSKMGSPESGLRADLGAGLNLKVKSLAFFVNNFAYVAGIPRTDTVNTGPTALLADANDSRIVLRGLSVLEIGVGHGREIPGVPGLLAGGNLKALVGKTGFFEFFVLREDPGSTNPLRKFTEGAKQSLQPALDLGLLWDMNRTWESLPMRPRVGLSARNINSPSFDQPDQAKLAGERSRQSLNGNARLGLAVSPWRFWNIAADVDLTRNLTPLDGVAAQTFGLGTEINVFNRTWLNIPLRLGISRNLAQRGSRTALSAGAGLNFLHFVVDLAVSASPSDQRIQSQDKTEKAPANLGASAQLALLFGGGKEEKKAAGPAPSGP